MAPQSGSGALNFRPRSSSRGFRKSHGRGQQYVSRAFNFPFGEAAGAAREALAGRELNAKSMVR
jgi:hypothetical protein